MKATTKRLIEAAKAGAEHRERKAMTPAVSLRAVSTVSPVFVDQMLRQERWYTFAELAEKFSVSYDTISRTFRNRPGVLQWGSDYRVSEAEVKVWLTENLAKRKAA
jgi:hypothetical protein